MPETPSPFDLVVIGSGPGGYIAAIRAAQLGLKVACIEKEPRLGGTCLRIGCIPSKALLDASERFTYARHRGAEIGLKFTDLQIDIAALMRRKDKVVDQLTGGVAGLFKKNKITRIQGAGKFLSAGEIEVNDNGSRTTLRAGKVLIATGSEPVELPFMKFDGKRILNSEQALALAAVPKKMVVIGAGAIGLELGSVWSRLGAQVTVLEMFTTILPGADEELARATERVLKKQGLTFFLGAKVTGATVKDENISIAFEWEGKQMQEVADTALVAVGRKPYTAGLGAAEIGVKFDSRGRIVVDKRFQTSVPQVFAIGDVIAGPMLAHKAEEEGVACAELIVNRAGHVNYDVIPNVVYTSPELASVGLTEEQLKAQKRAYVVGRFKFTANGRALCMDEAEGLVKVIADQASDKVLGVHILGPQASSLIAEAALAMEFGA